MVASRYCLLSSYKLSVLLHDFSFVIVTLSRPVDVDLYDLETVRMIILTFYEHRHHYSLICSFCVVSVYEFINQNTVVRLH